MKILVIGARGFVGKNFCAQLENIRTNKARWYKAPDSFELMACDYNASIEKLVSLCKKVDFIFVLPDVEGGEDANTSVGETSSLVDRLLEALKNADSSCPIVYCSSSEATLDNSFGRSIRSIEERIFRYGKDTGSKVLVYRLPKIFGKWCKPTGDNIIAILCDRIAKGEQVVLADPDIMLNLVYIDDVVDNLIGCLSGDEYHEGRFCYVPEEFKVRLGDVSDILFSFDKGRKNLQIPRVSDKLKKALYSTFVTYLPQEKISYPLEMKHDHRGSFSEFIRTENHGQVSININKPGVTKGQHWHNNLVERFLVVSGHGLIQLRKVGVDEYGNKYAPINYEVSGEKLEVVEMIPGYTHNLINLSDTEDMVTVIWANGCFDPNRPDTYSDPV